MGNTVHSKRLDKDIAAAFKTLAGGEMKSCTELLTGARNMTKQRMIAEAEELGTDAVTSVGFGSTSIMQSAAEVLACGMAVKLKKI